MQEYFPQKKYVLVFGAMEDKDIAGMFTELLPNCSQLLMIKAHHPRAAKLDLLQELASSYPCPQLEIADHGQVLPEAVRLAGEAGVVLIAGSLSAVGDFRSLWFEKSKRNEYN